MIYKGHSNEINPLQNAILKPPVFCNPEIKLPEYSVHGGEFYYEEAADVPEPVGDGGEGVVAKFLAECNRCHQNLMDIQMDTNAQMVVLELMTDENEAWLGDTAINVENNMAVASKCVTELAKQKELLEADIGAHFKRC